MLTHRASPITHNCARKQHHFIHCWKILLHFGNIAEENRRENACSDTQHIKYHHGNHTESSNTTFMKLLELSYMALSPKTPGVPSLYTLKSMRCFEGKGKILLNGTFYGLCYSECLRVEILKTPFVTSDLMSCSLYQP